MRSERDLVVHVVALAAARHGGLALARRRTAEIAAALVLAHAAATAAAVEHGERRVEALQHHLGRVALDVVLVGPLAGLQLALEIDLGALLQVLLGHPAEALAEDHHAVPLGLFLALAGVLVAPVLRGRDAQVDDRPAVLGPPHLRVLAEIADQDHLVDAAYHDRSPPCEAPAVRSANLGAPPHATRARAAVLRLSHSRLRSGLIVDAGIQTAFVFCSSMI